MQRALLRVLNEDFAIPASAAEIAGGAHQIDIASSFEARLLPDILATSFHGRWLDQFTQKILLKPSMAIWDDAAAHAMATRGLATFDPANKRYPSTAAAALLFSERPSDRFPQAEILLDAHGLRPSSAAVCIRD